MEHLAADQDDIVIGRISLVDGRGIEIVGGYLVPIDGGSLLGSAETFPPSDEVLSSVEPQGFHWQNRLGIEGTKLPAGTDWNLILGLAAGGTDAELKQIKIEYSSGGDQFELLTGTSVTIKIAPDSCS